jgi:hypothetical protein
VLDVALDDQVAEVADEDRLKWLLAVPRCVVLFFLDIASLVVVIAAWFAILSAGHEPGTDVYLVLDGVIRVERDRERLAEYGPAALLGERASLERGVRTATLVWSQPARWRRSTPGSWSAPPRRNCPPVTGGRDLTRLD